MLLERKTGFGRGRSGPKTTVPHHENCKGGEEVAVRLGMKSFRGTAQPCRLGKTAGYRRQLTLSRLEKKILVCYQSPLACELF